MGWEVFFSSVAGEHEEIKSPVRKRRNCPSLKGDDNQKCKTRQNQKENEAM